MSYLKVFWFQAKTTNWGHNTKNHNNNYNHNYHNNHHNNKRFRNYRNQRWCLWFWSSQTCRREGWRRLLLLLLLLRWRRIIVYVSISCLFVKQLTFYNYAIWKKSVCKFLLEKVIEKCNLIYCMCNYEMFGILCNKLTK